jgi:uncharacterized membrane protein
MVKRVGFWVAWYVPLVLLWLAFVDTFALAEVTARPGRGRHRRHLERTWLVMGLAGFATMLALVVR